MGKPVCDRHEYQYKFVLVGESGVGKTRLFAELTGRPHDIGSRSTIGVEFGSKLIEKKEVTLKAQVWDTTGQERFRSTIRPYYRGVSGALVTYNTAQKETFDNLAWWMEELRSHCTTDILFMLVAHKIDLKRPPAVDQVVARDFADRNKMVYVETSLIDSSEFESAFELMVRKIHKKRMRQSCVGEVTCIKCLRNARKVSSDEESEEEEEEQPKETSSFYV